MRRENPTDLVAGVVTRHDDRLRGATKHVVQTEARASAKLMLSFGYVSVGKPLPHAPKRSSAMSLATEGSGTAVAPPRRRTLPAAARTRRRPVHRATRPPVGRQATRPLRQPIRRRPCTHPPSSSPRRPTRRRRRLAILAAVATRRRPEPPRIGEAERCCRARHYLIERLPLPICRRRECLGKRRGETLMVTFCGAGGLV